MDEVPNQAIERICIDGLQVAIILSIIIDEKIVEDVDIYEI